MRYSTPSESSRQGKVTSNIKYSSCAKYLESRTNIWFKKYPRSTTVAFQVFVLKKSYSHSYNGRLPCYPNVCIEIIAQPFNSIQSFPIFHPSSGNPRIKLELSVAISSNLPDLPDHKAQIDLNQSPYRISNHPQITKPVFSCGTPPIQSETYQ